MLLFPGYLKRLTVAYYLQALVPHAMPDDSTVSVLLQAFREVPGIAVEPDGAGRHHRRRCCGSHATVESREYVLEQ